MKHSRLSGRNRRCMRWRSAGKRKVNGSAKSQAANQQLAFVNHLGRKMGVKKDKQLFVADDFLFPCRTVNLLQLLKFFFWEIQTGPVHVLVERSPTDRRFLGTSAPMYAV